MHASLIVISALAGSALALPGRYHNSTMPSHHPTHTLLPTGTGNGGGDKPSGGDHTTNPLPTATDGGHGSETTGSSVSTITETVTNTAFEPCSTAIGTNDGTTYYSTWLTTSVWETTTCYTTTVPTATSVAATTTSIPIETSVITVTSLPTETSVSTTTAGIPGGLSPNCPAQATVTATVTVTVGGNGEDSGSSTVPTQAPGEHCARCETITYTNTQGHTTTIVVPPFTEGPATATTTAAESTATGPAVESTATETATSAQTSAATTTDGGRPRPPLGTGTHSSRTSSRPLGTGSAAVPTESKTWHMARKFAL
ncbi:hypothetical protein FE257_000058 [Aspergillus nanangensis]|uniref:Extracellular proline-rich protein n=1 Tax=Aspergillus nanangensis TaxID=2582783 RepID=A0AAD4CYP3_ASPNN|nr:hypothetical protein FE257_000058 [Aspergillus nanangensis]